MTSEEHIQKAQELAKELVDVDDNQVKKIYNFLCRERKISALHQLVNMLPQSPFKDRPGRTAQYFRKIQQVIPRHFPESMNVDDAVQIFGWACRLLKYETLSRNQQQKHTKGTKGKTNKGGKAR